MTNDHNDLVLFCEFLVVEYYDKENYAASMTLSGIENFISLARRKAIKDGDMDDFELWAAISDQIRVMRDTASARRTSRRIRDREYIIQGVNSDHVSGLYHNPDEVLNRF